MPNATASNPITTVLPVRGASEKLSLEIGARVEILQHQVLKCSRYGFVQHIDGAYNLVHPELFKGSPAPEDCLFELYPNELNVVAVYRHPEFSNGARVKIVAPLNWGRRKPREFALVMGVSSDANLHPTCRAKTESAYGCAAGSSGCCCGLTGACTGGALRVALAVTQGNLGVTQESLRGHFFDCPWQPKFLQIPCGLCGKVRDRRKRECPFFLRPE